jgi:hypothetical protein
MVATKDASPAARSGPPARLRRRGFLAGRVRLFLDWVLEAIAEPTRSTWQRILLDDQVQGMRDVVDRLLTNRETIGIEPGRSGRGSR